MTKGYIVFVLHSHLPWVLGHGRWPHGTDWLNEAAAESYIPLLNQLHTLVTEGYKPALNIGITPILQEQLCSPQFTREFDYYIQNKIATVDSDIREFSKKGQKDYLSVARMWYDYYQQIDDVFKNTYKKNLLASFKRLQQRQSVEILTSAATHGYLPLLKYDRSVQAQVQIGTDVYMRNFGSPPRGMWLPECAYRPAYRWTTPVSNGTAPYDRKGIDEFLSKSHVQFFVTDAHMLKGGEAIGVYLSRFKALKHLWQHFEREFVQSKGSQERSLYNIYLVASNPHISPVAVFTRDPETASQVWSGTLGYPGEACYLDFHKKRFPGGLRYWSVTNPKNDLSQKDLYKPEFVEKKIRNHAHHFVAKLKTLSDHYYTKTKKPAVVCAPFDTELFGHWWFEGPRWLYHVIKLVNEEKELELATGQTVLETFKPDTVVTLPEGSWGEGGFHYIWLNQWTEWTWQRLYEVEDEFYQLLTKHHSTGHSQKAAFLKQLARELLLLQSSDWQFLISTWSARDYAELRFARHYENFKQLARILRENTFDDDHVRFLRDLEEQDSCFSDLDLDVFSL